MFWTKPLSDGTLRQSTSDPKYGGSPRVCAGAAFHASVARTKSSNETIERVAAAKRSSPSSSAFAARRSLGSESFV